MIGGKDHRVEVLLGGLALRASERGSLLTKTRLVKFLYLLDLYNAQSEKQTFTGWPWAFVHYGPYCRESTDAIDRAEAAGYLAARSYESKFGNDDFKLYGPGGLLREDEAEEVQRELPMFVWSNLSAAVHQWHDDTFGLLDYVYFHTGPMQEARPGENLSFEGEDKIDYAQFKPVEMIPLSKAKKKALRGIIDKMKAEPQEESTESFLYDKAYFEFVSTIAGEETPAGLSGSAKLRFEPSDD